MEQSVKVLSFCLAYILQVNSQDVPDVQYLTNISYGNEPEQIMDVYLPRGRDLLTSKIIVTIHGGAWTSGSKEDMLEQAKWFHSNFPFCAIVNMDYRLGTIQDPGFPKQIEDISLALQFLKSKSAGYRIQPQFGLLGFSAGAHLALLYAYAYDREKNVKVVCNIAGLTDLTDPELQKSIKFLRTKSLVGNYTYDSNPKIFKDVSPITYVNAKSPSTISFYGELDEQALPSQGIRLEDALDALGVYNKAYYYTGEGHIFQKPETLKHMRKKLFYFFNNYF